MYHQHFGLRQTPFSLTPDTGYFYNFASHREALDTLLVAIKMGEGFLKVTGEVGAGKTLLCRKLLNQLDDSIVTAYIPSPLLTPHELHEELAEELGISYDQNVDPHQLLKLIYAEMIGLRTQGKQIVLLIDEAQAMPLKTLEALRLLTNLETEKCKLLQVVLMGQPELDERLNKVSVRQIRQRITFSYTLSLMDKTNVEGYISHRLDVAGYSGAELFSHGAIKLLARASRGTPRIINILCHKALMAAYGQGVRHIDKRHIHAAVVDSECTRTMPFDSTRALDVGISVCLISGLGLIFAGFSL
jgi:MSHA biogenesis protein MshM